MRGINHTQDSPGWRDCPRFGGGGGTSIPSTTTSTTNQNPWSGQVGYLTGGGNGGTDIAPSTPGTQTGNYSVGPDQVSGLFPAAAALYNDTSAWPQYYPSSTYAGLTGPQENVIGQMYNYGTGGGDSAINAANNNIASTLSGAYTAPMQNAYNLTSGMNNWIGEGQDTGAANAAFQGAQGTLGNIANGGGLNIASQPGWQNAVNTALMSAIPNSAASFISGGRTDSGLAQAATTAAATNAIGNLANQAYQGQEQSAAWRARTTCDQSE